MGGCVELWGVAWDVCGCIYIGLCLAHTVGFVRICMLNYVAECVRAECRSVCYIMVGDVYLYIFTYIIYIYIYIYIFI